jgi:hypothetical protein
METLTRHAYTVGSRNAFANRIGFRGATLYTAMRCEVQTRLEGFVCGIWRPSPITRVKTWYATGAQETLQWKMRLSSTLEARLTARESSADRSLLNFWGRKEIKNESGVADALFLEWLSKHVLATFSHQADDSLSGGELHNQVLLLPILINL